MSYELFIPEVQEQTTYRLVDEEGTVSYEIYMTREEAEKDALQSALSQHFNDNMRSPCGSRVLGWIGDNWAAIYKYQTGRNWEGG